MEKGGSKDMAESNQSNTQRKAQPVCKRCKNTFDRTSNTASSCRFHPSFFVCRWHDDQQRYYDLKPDDPPYEAKFYDCCGAEDMEAPGCTTAFHSSYDDDS
ncbi:unnamed protein product [Calypogeia fissa]